MSRLTRRDFLGTSACLTVGMLLAACAPVAPQGQTQSGGNAPAAAKVSLLLWDGFGEDFANFHQIIDGFQAANPTIEIKHEAQANMRDIIRTALDADAGPDVLYYDTGPGFAGVLARAGLLLPLDDAYAQYNWTERVLPIAKDRTTFDGKTYGIGNEVETIGVFYNKKIFEAHGVSEPKNHDEFLALCEKLKGANQTPIAFGDQPKWPAMHTFGVFAGNIAGREKVAQAISAKIPWTDEDFVSAIQTPLVDMVKAGYYNTDVNAVSYDDANALFYAGQTAMSITGSWMVGNYTNPDTMKDPVGFFFYPAIGNKPINPPAGLGSGYFISKKTKQPEAALKFLDYVFSKDAAKVWLEGMSMIPPIQLNVKDYKISELLSFVLQQLQQNANTMSYNIDVLTPDNFNTAMFDGFQEVIGGTRTPADQAAAMEKAMQEAKAAGKVMDIVK